MAAYKCTVLYVHVCIMIHVSAYINEVGINVVRPLPQVYSGGIIWGEEIR